MSTPRNSIGRKCGHASGSRILSKQRKRADTRLVSAMLEVVKKTKLIDLNYSDAKAELFLAFDDVMIGRALAAQGGHIARAAESLGLHRQSLSHIMRKRGFLK